MIIKKEDLYSILVSQEELDIIADSINATNMQLDDVPEEEQEVKKRKQLLALFEPWTKIALCLSEP